MIRECGLYWVEVRPQPVQVIWVYKEERMVPLQSVHVDACLVETSAEVKITQTYYNSQSFPIEAIYVFPIDEHGAVCEFEAEIEGKKVIGVAKEKETAKREYDSAIARGDGAYLLEQEKADIFKAKVGNIPPGVQVTITIKYVTEMKSELDKMRFVVPTYVAPRYSPWYTPSVSSGGSPRCGISFNITSISMTGFNSIESPSHSIKATIGANSANIELVEAVTALDKDLLIMVAYAQPHEPKVVVEEDGKGSHAAMLTLFPHLEFQDRRTELIFVVDRSGSMGSMVKELREAMTLFLRSLPEDCYFNIVGFGSSFETFERSSVKYSDASLEKALKHVSGLLANLGGTEIYRPLEHIFKMSEIPHYSRQVFVLTDGQVSNTEQVLTLVKNNSSKCRTFSLGIGSSVSHHLVEGIARAGKGTSAFVMNNERMEKKVMKQLKDAIQPALEDIKIDWGIEATPVKPEAPVGGMVMSLLSYVSPKANQKPDALVTLQQSPFRVPPIFSDSHFRVYALFSGAEPPESVTIEAKSPDGLLKVQLPIDKERIIRGGKLIHTLAARSLIRDLEEGTSHLHAKGAVSEQKVKEEVIRLGTTYGLSSKYTSFIAVEERHRTGPWYAPPPPMPQPVHVNSAPMAQMRGGGGGRGGRVPPPKAMAMPMAMNLSAAAPAPTFEKMKKKSAVASKPVSRSRQAPQEAMRMSEEAMESMMDDESSDNCDDDLFAMEEKEEEKEERRSSLRKKEKKMDNLAPAPAQAPSASASASLSSSNPHGKLQELLRFQTAQGAFTYSHELLSSLGLGDQEATIQAELAGHAEAKKIWATCLVLAYLRARLGALEEEWEMVEAKAKRWLGNQKVGNLDALMAKAQAAF